VEAYKFSTTASDGFIKIPAEYSRKIPADVSVIVFPRKKPYNQKRNLFPDFALDTTGYHFDREEAHER
jgi:hypothetical protein